MSLGPRYDLSMVAYSPTSCSLARDADVLFEFGELVGAHQRHETHAAGGRRADAHADGVEQRPSQQQAGGGIAFHRVGEVGGELALVALPRRHHDAHAGLVLEFTRREHEVELQLRAVAEQRGDLQRVIGPLALAAGDQRALERGVRAVFEQIHQRLADDRAGVGVAEQFEPGLVGVDDDAFLHLQDGVVGTLQHGLQLAAIVARGLQRGVERALEAEGAQFARHHRLHAIGGRQRHDVARADAHARGDVAFGNLRAHEQHRHLGRELVAHGRGLLGVGFGHVGADQQFRD